MKKWFVAVVLTAGQASLALAAPIKLSSPDGSITLSIDRGASSFSVVRHGEMVIEPSPLGLELEGVPALDRLVLANRKDVKVKRSIPLVATKASAAIDNYNGTSLKFRERAGARRQLILDLRAYNDGVAFRYRMETANPVSVRSERRLLFRQGTRAAC
jgi:alpha-glucosidase